MSARGSVVIDGHIFAVEHLALENGELVITAFLDGPVSRRRSRRSEIRIHSADGKLVYRGKGQFGWPKVPTGLVLRERFRVSFPTTISRPVHVPELEETS